VPARERGRRDDRLAIVYLDDHHSEIREIFFQRHYDLQLLGMIEVSGHRIHVCERRDDSMSGSSGAVAVGPHSRPSSAGTISADADNQKDARRCALGRLRR